MNIADQNRAAAEGPGSEFAGQERRATYRGRSALARLGFSAEAMDPIGHGEQDGVALFGPAVLAIRWATVAVAVVLAVERLLVEQYAGSFLCVTLAAYAGYRTRYPHRNVTGGMGFVLIFLEVLLHGSAVVATDYWSSPLVFSLATAVAIAGFARGLKIALAAALFAAAIVIVSDAATSDFAAAEVRQAVQWTVIIAVIALIGGYTQRLTEDVDRQHGLALRRLGRLSDANSLLFSLHRVAQTLPASLDLDDVLDTTVRRLQSLFSYHGLSILVFDDTDDRWEVVRSERGTLAGRIGPAELPAPFRRAVANHRVIEVPDLTQAPYGPGTSPQFRSGLYSVLVARGQIIGLIAIEHDEAAHFTPRDVDLLAGFVDPVALAIDNARWFGRLRTVGADEERTRIARDLHDRIGQSLAYLAFELERIMSKNSRAEPVGSELEHLRDDVRSVIGEIRETLYDLRTDVSDGKDIIVTLTEFVERFSARTDVEVDIVTDAVERLPILQEREMWRIAQEALVNVERHAGARRARVTWRCTAVSAQLEVADDGQGFVPDASGRTDSYGILGMRERASSIGAHIEVDSAPGSGTTLRCRLDRT